MAVRASPSELGRHFLLENVSTGKTPLDKKASAFNMGRRTYDRTTSRLASLAWCVPRLIRRSIMSA
eukprot:7961870-Pyramimonas_sp.AAC.1